ncbi:MAG: hypothetical protein ABIJ96_16840 [Elusimicrobiota bacterium]
MAAIRCVQSRPTGRRRTGLDCRGRLVNRDDGRMFMRMFISVMVRMVVMTAVPAALSVSAESMPRAVGGDFMEPVDMAP